MKVIKADYKNTLHSQAILSLMQAYALDPMGGAEALSEYTQENLIANLQTSTGVFSVIAYEGEQAVGLINCVEGFSTFKAKKLVNIHDVIVLKTYRGQGIVHKMFNEVDKIAIALGCCKLTLEVLEGNEVAKSAYEKQGFSGYELDPKMGQAMFWQKLL